MPNTSAWKLLVIMLPSTVKFATTRQTKESLSQLSISGCFESQIGIILTVHGGPEQANGLLTGVIDGQALFDRVQAQLQQQYPLISIGWINHDMPFIKWSQPNLEQAAKSLIGSGAQTIVFKPLGWVTENYETILDVEDAIESLQMLKKCSKIAISIAGN